ncbi:MAG TPA: hypothetical protein VFT45_08885 [Longimicrobium sp.]|nr:hypothetical protein [Longimicrobium sp.]
MKPIHLAGGRPRRPRPGAGGAAAATVLALWLAAAGACRRGDERADDPSTLVEILAQAASTGRLDTLATLCDPSRQNDGFTQRVCEVPRRPGDREEFSAFFRDAKPGMWTSEDTAEGSPGMVLATVVSGRAIRFGTVRRGGIWYLGDMQPVGRIESGVDAQGTLTERAPEAWFVFHAPASGTYRIDMRSELPMMVELYDASGKPLADRYAPPPSPSESGWRETLMLVKEMEAASYWLRVTGYSVPRGGLRLKIQPG